MPNFNATLAHQALAAAGLPVVGVADLGAGGYRVDYDGTQTPQQVALGVTTLAALDLVAQLVAQQRAQAKAGLAAADGPGKALRAVLQGLYQVELETRTKVNEIVTLLNVKFPAAAVAPLVNRTPAQAFAAVLAAVDAGQAD